MGARRLARPSSLDGPRGTSIAEHMSGGEAYDAGADDWRVCSAVLPAPSSDAAAVLLPPLPGEG